MNDEGRTVSVDSQTHGKVAWFEIAAGDSANAREFWSGLLGWSFSEPFEGQDYHIANEGGGAVYGGSPGGGLLTYFSVAGIDESLTKVAELGGTAGEKQEIPGVGFYAHCADRDGNAFGLYQDA